MCVCVKGGGNIFLVVRQRILWKSNGALARHEIFEFNFIHDYDVIIIGHARARELERSSKVTGCRRVLNETERKKWR